MAGSAPAGRGHSHQLPGCQLHFCHQVNSVQSRKQSLIIHGDIEAAVLLSKKNSSNCSHCLKNKIKTTSILLIIIIIRIIIYFLPIAKDVTNTETTVMYGLRITQTA